MPEFHQDTLANGLRVITVPMPHLHAAEMMFFFHVGSRHEAPEVAGVSHFLEHMVFRGNRDYPTGPDLERAFEAIGGYVNAATDIETTCYHSRLHPAHLDKATELFASMLLYPLLRDLDTERRVILEEALEDLNEHGEEINPDTLCARLLWPDHPLGRPPIGSRESIEAMRREDLEAHRARYYTPRNLVAVVAGRVEHADFVAAVERHFGRWQGDCAPPPLPFEAAGVRPGPHSRWVRDSGSQVSLQLAFRAPGRGDAGSLALRVLRRVLSGGGSARLMLRLREELGLTYGVEAQLMQTAETGALAIDLSLAPESLERAVAEVLRLLDDLCAVPVPEEELAGVVRAFLYELEFSCDFTEELAARYGWGATVGNLRTLERERREVAALTPEVLLQTARAIFRPEALCLAVVGPWSEDLKRRVTRLLKGFRS
ncbi:M16 family metallopeptidase [Geoalkalibacter halelectricus]|uniref:Insulinase family protein n=1 Tax=Geoalkalibacter halelectricus TaxID=2847045 RepID=A0ABY5ZFJ3_9BACT|nr:pitrilysin family protein [Geoalkalibacter halelectricus]UWZ77938.1 insulinase family protein [Geoalkalibacter halelectricus]